MKTRPIGFTQENVKATHDGIKTKTRRVMNPQPVLNEVGNKYTFNHKHGVHWWWINTSPDQLLMQGFCPYGQVGDRFWLKETWGICSYSQQFEDKLLLQIAYKAGKAKINPHPDGMTHDLEWRTVDLETWHKYTDNCNFKWRGGRFMPKFASRTELELVSVGVERLQQITREDILAEGSRYPVTQEGRPLLRITGKYPPCEYIPKECYEKGNYIGGEELWIKAHFASLWDSINGKKHPWASNPWVWVLGYKLVEREAGL